MRGHKGEKQSSEPTSDVRLTWMDATGFPEKPCLIDPLLIHPGFLICTLIEVLHRLLCADVQYTSMGVWVLGSLALCGTREKGCGCVDSCSTEGVLYAICL